MAGDDEFLDLYFDESQVVEAATRIRKPINQVAENVTIITAEEIERMNAHNVDDVLNRVAGVYVDYGGLDFNTASYIYIQGSDWEHVTVLLDGVRVNKSSVEVAWVNMVPVRIIKRIEVIKGAASSTWGSALGGVINIITKDPGKSKTPQVDLVTSFGEKDTHDITAEVAGKVSSLSYYVYAGNQESDGLLEDRFFKNTTGYGKFHFDFASDMTLDVSGFYSQPEFLHVKWLTAYSVNPPMGYSQELHDKNTFMSARFDALIAEGLNFHAEIFRFDNDYRAFQKTTHRPITLIEDFFNDQESTGGALRFDYLLGKHALVAGIDYQRNEVQMTWKYRDSSIWDFFYPHLAPMGDYYEMDLLAEDVSGYYLNGTFVFDDWTITPGVRLDHISTVSDELISPSLGVTYQLSDASLLRASVSRGFRKPPVWYLEGDALYSPTVVNPDLDAEKNWTYQIGLESKDIPYLHVKTTLFHHDVENTWVTAPDYSIWKMNGDRSQRQGFEFEVRTEAFYHLSLQANFTYTYTDWPEDQADHSSTANIIFIYDHPDILTAEISGHYVKWGELLTELPEPLETNNFLWDISLNKEIFSTEKFRAALFGVVRNLFNSSQYVQERFENSPRHAEVGLKLNF
ncbi:MAG: TonB-dependent receptor [Thermodesulfobacteriota bacterium]